MTRPDRDRLTKQFIKLTSLDAPGFHERAIADLLIRELEALGFQVIEDDAGERYQSEAGNLYGYLPGTNPGKAPVLFSSHMDTVEPARGKRPQLDAQQGIIRSDGSTVLGADDVCGITEILEGIHLAKEDPEGYGDIEVLFTIAEEVYGKGAQVFDYSRLRSADAYVLDMSGAPGRAARQQPSIISFEAEITGKAAHAGFAPETGINALQAAAQAIAKIPQGRISDQTTLNIGTIRAGEADNIVAGQARCTGEVRSFLHEEALAAVGRAGQVFEEAAKALGAQARFESVVRIRAYETPLTARVCRDFQAACQALGLPGELGSTHGGSDNNVFAEHGISGIVLSCGMYRTHSTEEYTKVDDLVTGARLVAQLIKER